MPNRFVCGWCGHTTAGNPCLSCGRDSVVPWTQRGMEPPTVADEIGRPPLDAGVIRAQYEAAKAALARSGQTATTAALAEQLGIGERTLRDWRKRFELE